MEALLAILLLVGAVVVAAAAGHRPPPPPQAPRRRPSPPSPSPPARPGLGLRLRDAASRLNAASLKGGRGEAQVAAALRRDLDAPDAVLFNNVTLPAPQGTTQIDHVLLSRRGVFVIETKTLGGWIFGDADRPFWTQVHYRRKQRIANPLRQNHGHAKAVRRALDIRGHLIRSVVAFVGSAEPRTTPPPNVVWSVRDLIR